jgi:hypothetical protein
LCFYILAKGKQNMNDLKTSILTAALALASLTSANARNIITEWNFNSTTPDGNVGTGTTSPSFGDGTITLVGGTSASFATGIPADLSSTDNSRYSVATFPASGTTTSKTAGIQFNVSTLGYTDISFAYQIRHSNTSANTHALLYTLDRNSPGWLEAAVFSFTPASSGTGDTWYSRSHNFASVTGLNGNANAAFRIVSAFDTGASNYLASQSGKSYGTSGTYGFDLVQVSGVPEPSSATLLGLGFLALLGVRRLARKS